MLSDKFVSEASSNYAYRISELNDLNSSLNESIRKQYPTIELIDISEDFENSNLTALSFKDKDTNEVKDAEGEPQPVAPQAPKAPDAVRDTQAASTPAEGALVDETSVAQIGDIAYSSLAEAVMQPEACLPSESWK